MQVIQNYYENKGSESALLHFKGWCSLIAPVNGTSYIFYGGYIQREGVEYFEDILALLSPIVEDEEEDEEYEVGVSGYFLVQGEDGQNSYACVIHNHVVTIEEASPLFQE